MKRLEGTEMWSTYEVARRVNELAEETEAELARLFNLLEVIEQPEVWRRLDSEIAAYEGHTCWRMDSIEELRAKLDCLFERMDSIEGVGADGHHEAPIITVGEPFTVVNLPPLVLPPPGDVEERFPHSPDYGAPGSWGDAYAGVCELYVAARQEVLRLQDLLEEGAIEPDDWDDEGGPGDCAECGHPYQIVRPGKVQPMCRCDEVRQLTEELAELRRRLAEKPVGLLAENEKLRADNASLACGYAERLGDHQENERLRAENVALRRDQTLLQVRMQKRSDENERLRVAAANWALVERMPECSGLIHTKPVGVRMPAWVWQRRASLVECIGAPGGDRPDDALRAAQGEVVG